MSDLDKYRKRFKRKWASNRKYLQSLECMGITLDEAIELEMFNICLSGVPWPDVIPHKGEQ